MRSRQFIPFNSVGQCNDEELEELSTATEPSVWELPDGQEGRYAVIGPMGKRDDMR